MLYFFLQIASQIRTVSYMTSNRTLMITIITFTTVRLYIRMPSTLKETYERDGFVLVPNLLTEDELILLRGACERVIAKTRSGEWTHRRTVGKQFPPYGNDSSDSWGVQHIMHPDLHELAFVKWYTSDALVSVVKKLLECKEEDLQMGLRSRSFEGPNLIIFCRAVQSFDKPSVSQLCAKMAP